jgi:hypothetical protein
MSQLTKSETASLLNVCEKTVERWAKAGILTPRKHGRRIVFDTVQVAQLRKVPQ